MEADIKEQPKDINPKTPDVVTEESTEDTTDMAMVEIGKHKFSIDGYLKSNLDTLKHEVRQDRDALLIIDGLERCFCNIAIKTPRGDFTIEELYAKSNVTDVLSFNFKTNKIEPDKAKIIPTGEQEVWELETIDGRKVQATLNHTFFIQRDGKVIEVQLKQIKLGDLLICTK
jgi:intein/homing endonuclease